MKGYKGILSSLSFIVIVLLAYYYWNDFNFQPEDFIHNLKNINIAYLLIALGLYILSVYLFALRWRAVLNSMGYNLKASSLFPIIFGAIPINNLTPANRAGGEPLRMVWIKKNHGVSYPDSVVSIIFERTVEAIPIGLMGIYALYIVLPFCRGTLKGSNDFGYFALTTIILIVIVFVFRGRITVKLRSAIYKYTASIKIYYSQLRSVFVPTLFLSTAVWVMDIMRFKFITMALGLHVHIEFLLIVSILYLVFGSVPLTPGGVGVVEGGLITSLKIFGMTALNASGIVFLERLISYVIASIIGSFYLIGYGGLTFWKNIRSQ